jgi:cell division protein FtsB
MHVIIILTALAVAFVTGVILARQIIAEVRSVKATLGGDLNALHARIAALETKIKAKLP